MGRQDMLKLAAYNRLRKVASAARVIRQNRAMMKVAEDAAPELNASDLYHKTNDQVKELLSRMDPESAAAFLRKVRNAGYITAGVLPTVSTAGGGLGGYAIGRLLGGRTGGMIGAAGGAGLGLGASALPSIFAGVGGGMANRIAKELDAEVEKQKKEKGQTKNKP